MRHTQVDTNSIAMNEFDVCSCLQGAGSALNPLLR